MEINPNTRVELYKLHLSKVWGDRGELVFKRSEGRTWGEFS